MCQTRQPLLGCDIILVRSIAIAMTNRKLTDIFLQSYTFLHTIYSYHAGPDLKIKPTLDAK